jgi:hypothetical protein
MTDANLTKTAEPEGELRRLRDSYREVEFVGELLSEVSTDNNSSPRWTEMELYRITEGDSTGKYVLSVMGRSVVYHVHNGTCNSGVPVGVKEIDEEFEPCHRCNPPRPAELGRVLTVDLEEDRPQVHVVADPQELLRKLHNPKANAISGPGQRLLAIAAMNEDGSTKDEGIFNAINRVERL